MTTPLRTAFRASRCDIRLSAATYAVIPLLGSISTLAPVDRWP
jgi:hypothetical protein